MGRGLGGTNAAELMLQLFSAFNIVALACISALPSGSWLSLWPEQRTRNAIWKKIQLALDAWAPWLPIFKGLLPFPDCHSRMYRFFGKSRKLYLGSWARIISLSMAARFRFRPLTRMLPNIPRLPMAHWNRSRFNITSMSGAGCRFRRAANGAIPATGSSPAASTNSISTAI